MSPNDEPNNKRSIYYRVTGSAAYARIQPLVPKEWIPIGPYSPNNKENSSADHPIDFLWENAPRSQTKALRDTVCAYSHLPNGTSILDSKWVLARLLEGPHALETYCFKGCDFNQFARERFQTNCQREYMTDYPFPDLLLIDEEKALHETDAPTHPSRPNLWFIKDAQANGAGGLWMVGNHNWKSFLIGSESPTPLIQDHHYVAQVCCLFVCLFMFLSTSYSPTSMYTGICLATSLVRRPKVPRESIRATDKRRRSISPRVCLSARGQ